MAKKFSDLVDYFAFLEEKGIIDENGSFYLHPKKIAKGWSENLDVENWEIEEVEEKLGYKIKLVSSQK